MKYLLCFILILITPLMVLGSSVSSQTIDRQEMEQIVQDFLADKSELLPHVELSYKSIIFPQPYSVPQGRIDHQVIPARPGVIGSRRFTLVTRVDGRTVSNKSIRIELEAAAEIAVTTSALRRGAVLRLEDVEMRYQDISKFKEPIFDQTEIIGKRMKRSVRLGDPLQKHQIEFPPVIKRGERVVIQAVSKGLSLSAVGEARQDGRSGEAIRVMNSSSRKEVLCQVVAPGLVKVEF
jgi:flagellar basal body P-ring formation protein FlgA